MKSDRESILRRRVRRRGCETAIDASAAQIRGRGGRGSEGGNESASKIGREGEVPRCRKRERAKRIKRKRTFESLVAELRIAPYL